MANIRKRGNTYQIRVGCGYNAKGEQISRSMTWRPPVDMTEKQAEKEVQKQAILFEEKCLHGQVTTNVKFEEFAEQWFKEYAELNLRSTSLERMKNLTKRVYPAIGHIRLDKITARQIQQFINDLAKNGKNLRSGKPLSRKTVVHHLSFISDVFGYAVKMDMLSENPCAKVSVPKGEKKEKEIYRSSSFSRSWRRLRSSTARSSRWRFTAVFVAVSCLAWSGRISTSRTMSSASSARRTTQKLAAPTPTRRKRRSLSARSNSRSSSWTYSKTTSRYKTSSVSRWGRLGRTPTDCSCRNVGCL